MRRPTLRRQRLRLPIRSPRSTGTTRSVWPRNRTSSSASPSRGTAEPRPRLPSRTVRTPSVTLTNSAFDYVVDAVAYNANVALTSSAGQTNAFNVTSAAPAFSGAGSIKTNAANTTMSWTAVGAQQWAAVAVPLQSANPQILFDAVSSATFAAGTNPIAGSWNHTTTTAANRYLVVGVNIDLNARASTTASVFYGTEGGGPNSAMTLLGALSNGTNG